MSTSGSTDFGLVTNELLEEAFSICGAYSEGEAISPFQYADGRRSLNILVKHKMAKGHLWLNAEAGVTLVASQSSYALATLFSKKPLRVTEVRRRITSSSIDTPLIEMSRQEYFETSNKSIASTPTAFYYDPQRATGTLYIWPTASASVAAAQTLRVGYHRPIEDFDGSGDDPDLPQECHLSLIYDLAEQLAVKGYCTDASRRQEIYEKAALYRAEIEAWDTEPASLFLQPEQRWC